MNSRIYSLKIIYIKMNKSKSILIFAFLLLCLNAVLLTFIFFKKPHARNHGGPKNEIIERLNFDKEQVLAYELLIETHRHDVQGLNQLIRDLKGEMYSTLHQENEKVSAGILQIIGEKQMEMEEVHFNHFIDLKEICREDQMDQFKKLEKDLVNLFGAKKPHR